MNKTFPCHFEFQHTPTWCAEFYISDKITDGMCVDRSGEDGQDFERFKNEFFQKVKRKIIFYAHYRVLIVPTNFVSEFWTPEFVHKLSVALKRPYKNPKVFDLKGYLKASWKYNGPEGALCDMTADELVAHLNKVFETTRFKPRTVSQMAYRLNLFSTRKPGPRGFATN